MLVVSQCRSTLKQRIYKTLAYTLRFLQPSTFVLSSIKHPPKVLISLTTTRCRRGCVERQSIMVKRKFAQEMSAGMEEPYLPHLMQEEQLKKKQKLPAPPKIAQ